MKTGREWVPQLIAFDFDGTLLTSEGILAPMGSRLLKEAARKGVYVVPATSRAVDSVECFCQILEIHGPSICLNGARVYASARGPIWSSLTFPKDVGVEIAVLADNNGWELSTTIGDVTYWRQRPGQPLGLLSPTRAIVAKNVDAVTDSPTRILVSDPEGINSIRSLCQSRYADRCHTEVYYGPDGRITSLGVYAPGANKGDALDLVLHRLGISRRHVMVIGDNVNDIPMFKRAQISIAMSNAPEQVKQIATVTAPSNDDEGVAWALKEFGISP